MNEKSREKFIITGINKEIRTIGKKEELVFKFKVSNSKMELLFKTKKSYEGEYDRLFNKFNYISANVEYINKKTNSIVISAIRYLRDDTDGIKQIG